MRKIIYAFCITIFASLFVLSCSGDEFYDDNPLADSELGGSNLSTVNLDIPDQFKIIGEKHNEGLDAAFAAIKSHYKQVKTRSGDTLTRLSKSECLLIAEQGLKKFCTEKVDNYSDELYGQTRSEVMPRTRGQKETMTPKVSVLVEQMKKLLIDEPDSPAQLVRGLNDINKAATAELSEVEAIAIYAGTSTCYNSYMYWKENRMKWLIVLNNPELASEFDDEDLNHFILKKGKLVAPVQTRGWWNDTWGAVGETWDSTTDYVSDWWSNGGGKEVVIADAGSAVAGALNGAVVGGTAGSVAGGVGAVPGAAAGAIAEGITDAAKGSIIAAVTVWSMKQ